MSYTFRMRKILEDLKIEVEERLATGEEPPWAMQSYKQLLGAINQVADGLSATITLEDLQRSAEFEEIDRPQLADNGRPNIAQLRPGSVRVQLPM